MSEKRFKNTKEYQLDQSIDNSDMDSADLEKAWDIHQSNKMSPQKFNVSASFGDITAPVSMVDLEESEKTAIIIGGTTSSFNSMQAVGIPLALQKYKTILIPHLLNKQVEYDTADTSEFIKGLKKIEEEEGEYSTEGEYIAKLIEEFDRNDELVGGIDLIGFSSGAPAILRAAEKLFAEDSTSADKISKVILMHPAGCYSPEESEGIKKFGNEVSVATNFVKESLQALPIINPNEYMLKREDILPLGRVPARTQIPRIVSSILEETAPIIDTEIHALFGQNDKVFSYEKVGKDIENGKNSKKVKTHVVTNANHNYYHKNGFEYADIINNLN